jgi:hypothetical protein
VKHERLQQEQRDIDQFLDNLALQTVDAQVDDMATAVRGLAGFEDEVRERALRYLSAASD